MRRLGRRTAGRCGAVVSTVAVMTICGAPTANAGGAGAGDRDVPDVAMVVAGGTGRTDVFRSGEAAFACLRRLLAPTYTGTERVPDAWAEGRYPPVDLTVVWGLSGVGGWPRTDRAPGGDVAVERQDQLFVAADGTPWVRSDPAPEVRDDDIRWHRAPRSVFVELEREKVLGEGFSGRLVTGGDGGRDGIRWAVSGLGAGLVAGIGGMLLMRRAAARHGAGPPRDEPRQELIDL